MSDRQQPTSKAELLRAVYKAIQWDRLYERLPGAGREQVDELFAEMRQAIGGAPAPPADLAAEVAGSALEVYCDGASRGNPGPAGIGVVLHTPDGREIIAWGESIGEATNNVAEYAACIAGLRKALELHARQVRVLSDSELLIKQIDGQYRVRNAGLKPLHAEVMDLLGRFDGWQVAHIPRDRNAQADKLAAQHSRKR